MSTFFFTDSILSSHPVSVPVNHPSEIGELFDEISYKKGGSIIRMMANFLGQDVFNAGIESYLKKYKYKNAKQVIFYDLIYFICITHTSLPLASTRWALQTLSDPCCPQSVD